MSRRRGVDPRDVGSGNIGATNVARAAGVTTGLLTLIGDAVKGLVPVLIALRSGSSEQTAALVGLAAFFGHIFSCFLRFAGGKGVATALGVSFGLAPIAATIVLPLFAVVAALSGYVSVASLAAAFAMPPLAILLGYSRATVGATMVMAGTIAVRHRDNIRRLRFGTEARIRRPESDHFDSGIA